MNQTQKPATSLILSYSAFARLISMDSAWVFLIDDTCFTSSHGRQLSVAFEDYSFVSPFHRRVRPCRVAYTASNWFVNMKYGAVAFMNQATDELRWLAEGKPIFFFIKILKLCLFVNTALTVPVKLIYPKFTFCVHAFSHLWFEVQVIWFPGCVTDLTKHWTCS